MPVRWRCDPRKTPDPQMGRVPGGMARPRPAQLLTHLSHSLCPRMGNCNSTELYNNPQSQWHFKNVIQGKCEIFQIIGHRPLRSLHRTPIISPFPSSNPLSLCHRPACFFSPQNSQAPHLSRGGSVTCSPVSLLGCLVNKLFFSYKPQGLACCEVGKGAWFGNSSLLFPKVTYSGDA